MILLPIIFTAVVAVMTFNEPKIPTKTTQEIYKENGGREQIGHQK